MRPSERRDWILAHIEERGRVTVDSLAHALAISRETVRRDLSTLAGSGHIRKLHGGASLTSTPRHDGITEGPFHSRMHENVPQKRRVARAAASLFKPGDSLFIDTGTTTVFFAEELGKRSGLTVITNSAIIAEHVSNDNGNRVFLVGGEYRAGSGENVGRLALEQIRKFRSEHVVLTVGALDTLGISDFDLEETEVARAMIAQGRRLTVILDSSKLARTGVFQICGLDRLQQVILDQAPTGAVADALRKAEIEICIAK